jgi:hypothetical protein
LIKDAADDSELDIDDLLSYNISLSIDNYDSTVSNIIDEINKAIVVDKNNKIIYITVSLY